MLEKTLVVRPGQKFLHMRKNIVYVVKRFKDGVVALISEDGRASMLIQVDDFMLAGLEPMIDPDPLFLSTK